MLTALLVELFLKTLALLLTVWAAQELTSGYVEAVTEATRAYLTLHELLDRQNHRLRR